MERDLRRLGDRAAEQAERDEDRERRRLAERLGRPVEDGAKSTEPVCWMRMKSASANVASPIAFMTKAFLPAATALERRCQKLISR